MNRYLVSILEQHNITDYHVLGKWADAFFCNPKLLINKLEHPFKNVPDKGNIVIDSTSEVYAGKPEYIQNVIDECKRYEIDPHRIVLVTARYECESDSFKVIVSSDYWFFRTLNDGVTYTPPQEISGKFRCLMGATRTHRAALFLTMCSMGLTNNNYVTYNNFRTPWEMKNMPDCVFHDVHIEYAELSEKYNFKEQFESLDLPVTIDLEKRLNYNNGDVIDTHNNFWKDFAYDFDVISETSIKDLFYTEKTARALIMGKPFLLIGAQNSMHNLIDRYGLISPKDYINLDYDTYEQNSDRIEGLCMEINRIMRLDSYDYSNTIKGISDIASLNAQIIISKFE